MRQYCLFIVLIHIQVEAQFTLDLETGFPILGYNEVRIPNEGATTFDFERDFDQQGLVIPLRVRPGYSFGRNHFFGLFAPLGINYEGPAPFDIRFQNSTFEAGRPIEGFYKFNSYRLTYRRDLVHTDRWTIGLGFTGKIRDASVRLSTDGISDRKDDVGFVPLLHVYAAWVVKPGWSTIYLEGDGLAGGPGRAFDFFLGGRAELNDNFALKYGYRILEGGADVGEVYNFTLVNFISIGVIWTLGGSPERSE
jgi:hypothetical protein